MKDQIKTKAQLLAELATHKKREAEQAGLLAREERQRALLEVMYQANMALHSTLQYDQVLDHILDQLPQIVSHDAACIILTQGVSSVRIVRWHGYSQFGSSPPVSGGLGGSSFKIADIPSLTTMQENGLPFIVAEATEDDAWVVQSDQLWIKSYMAVPIRVQGQIIGFVQVDSAAPNFFSQADVDRLQTLVSQAAVALRNAWLYSQARREIMARVKALKTERNFVSTVLDQAGALVILLNAEQRIIRYNQTCEKTLGYSYDEVKGKFIWDLFTTTEEVEATQTLFNKLATKRHSSPGRPASAEYESQWLTKEGQLCQIAWSSTALVDHHGSVDYIVNTGHDITERKKIEEALRQGGERYALAVLATNEGLWDWDLQTNEIYFSPRWKAILGFQEEEMQPSVEEWFSRVHPEDLARLKIDIADHFEGVTTTFKSEYRMLHWDGDYRWVRTQGLAVRDVHGQPYRMTGSQADITRRKLDEEQLLRASLQDALTGLPNRAAFMNSLKGAIEQAQTSAGYQFAILFLDLDRFKQVNDSLGHLVGDQLLVTVAHRLKECLRSEDSVARLGGDEFTILLENVRGADDAVLVANRIQEKLALPIRLAGQELFISASIGISLGGADYILSSNQPRSPERRSPEPRSPEDILNDADGAMYQAKAQGRARYAMYRVGQPYIIEGQPLETELRQAIEQEQFELYYQPIVSMLTGQIVGVEALLRWQHPQRGLIMPDEFVLAAEETGLINSIGEWMMRAACTQMKQWHNAGYASLRLCVNVSVRQFQPDGEPEFPKMFANILEETGLTAQAVEVEITESIPLVDNEFNQSILNALRALGLQIALDDFSVNTPLGLLKQFSVHTLKVDRSFVKGLTHNAQDAAIIEAIIKLAHSLNLKVVVEGVETVEQLAWLRAHQCDEVQGYLFSPPIPASQVITWIHKSISGQSNFSDVA